MSRAPRGALTAKRKGASLALALMLALAAAGFGGCDMATLDAASDRALTRAAATGGCLKAVCHWPPLACGPRVGVCR